MVISEPFPLELYENLIRCSLANNLVCKLLASVMSFCGIWPDMKCFKKKIMNKTDQCALAQTFGLLHGMLLCNKLSLLSFPTGTWLKSLKDEKWKVSLFQWVLPSLTRRDQIFRFYAVIVIFIYHFWYFLVCLHTVPVKKTFLATSVTAPKLEYVSDYETAQI